jgi:hypothetical protein
VLGPFRLTSARGPVDLGNKKLCGLMAFLACAAFTAKPRYTLARRGFDLLDLVVG